MNKVERIKTPRAVSLSLFLAGIKSTGDRSVDIPKYWSVMSNLKANQGSPAAKYEEAKQHWINTKG